MFLLIFFCHVFVCCACPSIQINSFFVTPASQISFKDLTQVSREWVDGIVAVLFRDFARNQSEEWRSGGGPGDDEIIPMPKSPICPCGMRKVISKSIQLNLRNVIVMY